MKECREVKRNQKRRLLILLCAQTKVLLQKDVLLNRTDFRYCLKRPKRILIWKKGNAVIVNLKVYF